MSTDKMTTQEVIKQLNALGDYIEDAFDDPNEYLEAIGMAQDALRSYPTDEFAL